MGEDVEAPDVSSARPHGKWRRRLRRLAPLFALGMLAAAGFIIFREVSTHDPAEIWDSFVRTRPVSAALTLTLCLVSFSMLALIERSALQMLHRDQPFWRVVRCAFITYGLSNAIGFSVASAPATRARVYRGRLRAREIGALSGITAASVVLGAITAAGLGLLIDPPRASVFAAAPDVLLRLLGAALIAPALSWILVSARRDDVAFWGMRVRSLGFGGALLQVSFTTIDWLATAGILYVFLAPSTAWSYLNFVAVFVSAGLFGAISGTPGGLGTFEATIISLSPAPGAGPHVIAALVAYRMIFTVFPLGVAAVLLGFDFLRTTKRGAEKNAPNNGDQSS